MTAATEIPGIEDLVASRLSATQPGRSEFWRLLRQKPALSAARAAQ